MSLLVDSHCHLNFDPLMPDLDGVLTRAEENGVGHLLCVSVNLEHFPEVLTIAHDHSHIYASVGVHPNERDGDEPAVEDLLRLADDPRIIAIGETGLDYYRSDGDLDWQQQRFRRHIQAAKRCRKPLIIHSREAREDTIAIMREEGANDVGGVMHCFTESWGMAKQALDLNFYISFSGIVTFKNADNLRAVAKKVPADRLLIETDSPYLAPVPYRGKTNEPAYVRHVAACLAQLRNSDIESIAATTTANFFQLFQPADALTSAHML